MNLENEKLDRVIELLTSINQKLSSLMINPISIVSKEIYKDINNILLNWSKTLSKKFRIFSDKEFETKLNFNLPKPVKEEYSISQSVYKESINGQFVLVGCILPFSSILEFRRPKDVYIKIPTLYYPEWYIKSKNESYSLFTPSNKIIEIVNKVDILGKGLVTGYILENGRTVYYDQYL